MPLFFTCINCGNTFEGKFCNACGEKFYTDKDKSFKHLAEEAVHFITHFDSKFLITLKSVLLKTGQYALAFTQGKRKKYIKPVTLFLIVVVLYLIFPMFKGLNMQFNTYLNPRYGYTSFAVPIVNAKISKGITREELKIHYDETSPKFAKFLLLLYLPLTAAALSLLFIRRRKFFFDHFILATELNTFYVFVLFLVVPLMVVISEFISPPSVKYFNDDGIAFISVFIMFIIVTSFAFKRFYQEKWIWSSLKAIIFMLLYNFVIKSIYNIVLFLLVMFFLH